MCGNYDNTHTVSLYFLCLELFNNQYFTIDTLIIHLMHLSTLDYLSSVYVQDAGDPVLFDMATLIVNVTDVNDSPPKFKDSHYLLEIPENLVQDSIYTFVAQDADIGENARITYRIACKLTLQPFFYVALK